MEPDRSFGLFGAPPAELCDIPGNAHQFSPLTPGALSLEALAPEGLGGLAMNAPQGTIERRSAIALALRALRPDAPFAIMAPKDKGGARLRAELRGFGCTVEESSKRHYRICTGLRPSSLEGIDAAIAEGAPRLVQATGLWSQPGIFSWDRIDPGSALLLANLPPLSGQGADIGSGIGVLAHAVLASEKVKHLTLIDIDRRAVDCARRNVADPRADFRWADIRNGIALQNLDFVVMNPPFHDGGREDQALGQEFIRRAAESLRRNGVCRLVANRHLAYEAVLAPLFKRVAKIADAGGYKVIEALK